MEREADITQRVVGLRKGASSWASFVSDSFEIVEHINSVSVDASRAFLFSVNVLKVVEVEVSLLEMTLGQSFRKDGCNVFVLSNFFHNSLNEVSTVDCIQLAQLVEERLQMVWHYTSGVKVCVHY